MTTKSDSRTRNSRTKHNWRHDLGKALVVALGLSGCQALNPLYGSCTSTDECGRKEVCSPQGACVPISTPDGGGTDMTTNGFTCKDGVQNGPEETDVDCGGTTCGPCSPGQHCLVADDCATRICTGQRCVAFPTTPPTIASDGCIVTDVVNGRQIGPAPGTEGQPSHCDSDSRAGGIQAQRRGNKNDKCTLPSFPPVPQDRWGGDSNAACERDQGLRCIAGVCAQ